MKIGDEKKSLISKVTFDSYPSNYLSISSFDLLLMKTMHGVLHDSSYICVEKIET